MQGAYKRSWTLVLMLALVGCGGDDSTAPDNLTAADLAGTWTGTTSQGRALSFTVTSAGITSASLGYQLSGAICIVTAEATVTGAPVPIIDGEFDTGVIPFGLNTTLEARGRFTSTSEGSGSATISDGDCAGTVSFSWTVSKP